MQVPYAQIISLELDTDGLHLSTAQERLHLAVESPDGRGQADYRMTAVLLLLIEALRRKNHDKAKKIIGFFDTRRKFHRRLLVTALFSVLATGASIGWFHTYLISNPHLLLAIVLLAFLVPIATAIGSYAVSKRALSEINLEADA